MVKNKIVNLFIIFLRVFSSFSTVWQFHSFKPSVADAKLANDICKITNDLTRSSTDTQDILVGNVGGQAWSSTVNDIITCIDDRNAVVVMDFKHKITEKSLRKASVVILILEWSNQVS
ncbi:hypothetical protein ACKWTF_015841 [Chironomus riparius]